MNNEFWLKLHSIALDIVELNNSDRAEIDNIASHLEQIEIAYDRTFDPADDYPEYVATRLCCALQKFLAKAKTT